MQKNRGAKVFLKARDRSWSVVNTCRLRNHMASAKAKIRNVFGDTFSCRAAPPDILVKLSGHGGLKVQRWIGASACNLHQCIVQRLNLIVKLGIGRFRAETDSGSVNSKLYMLIIYAIYNFSRSVLSLYCRDIISENKSQNTK